MKRIFRYLLGTVNKGMTFRTKKDITLDVYIDAGFSGMCHSAADVHDPVRVKSVQDTSSYWQDVLSYGIQNYRQRLQRLLQRQNFVLSSAVRDLILTQEILGFGKVNWTECAQRSSSTVCCISRQQWMPTPCYPSYNDSLNKTYWCQVFLIPVLGQPWLLKLSDNQLAVT